jgi:predicted dehydrogenase
MTAGDPVRWGVLGTASIARKLVIPAMQRGTRCRVVAIASRDDGRARTVAEALGIARAYGSYEALLDDAEVDAVYIPLPNHLHVPWSSRAAEAGKHVLCEKPIATSAAEARELLTVRKRTGVLMGEAFMVRTHPQWLLARELVGAGRIGELRLIVGHFSYFRRDPEDVRSRIEFGGGALLDIGCYPVTLSRWLFGEEPLAATAMLERDPDFGVDRLGAGLLRFPSGQASFTFGGQLVPFQSMQLFGTRGRMHVEIPFNAPSKHPCRIFLDDGSSLPGGKLETLKVPAVDQYTVQADQFSEAIRGRAAVPVPLEDAIANMAAIDALFRSAESGRWEELGDRG